MHATKKWTSVEILQPLRKPHLFCTEFEIASCPYMGLRMSNRYFEEREFSSTPGSNIFHLQLVYSSPLENLIEGNWSIFVVFLVVLGAPGSRLGVV